VEKGTRRLFNVSGQPSHVIRCLLEDLSALIAIYSACPPCDKLTPCERKFSLVSSTITSTVLASAQFRIVSDHSFSHLHASTDAPTLTTSPANSVTRNKRKCGEKLRGCADRHHRHHRKRTRISTSSAAISAGTSDSSFAWAL